MKTKSGPTRSKRQSGSRNRAEKLNGDILVCRSRSLYLFYDNSNGWHEGPQHSYLWALDFHCYGDPSFEEVVRNDKCRSHPCLNGVVDLCVLARTPFREDKIHSEGQWLWSGELFWNVLRRWSCCCYCLSARMVLLRRIGGWRESVFLIQMLEVEAEVDRNGYGGRDDHAAQMAGHML